MEQPSPPSLGLVRVLQAPQCRAEGRRLDRPLAQQAELMGRSARGLPCRSRVGKGMGGSSAGWTNRANRGPAIGGSPPNTAGL
jgi:hypothetical protein